MKTLFKQHKTFLVLGLIFTLLACSRDESSNSSTLEENGADLILHRSGNRVNVFKGPEVNYGLGKARSFMSVDREGFPMEIGIELTSEVMDDLSILETGHELEIVLPLHHKAKELTPFEHLVINYQPHGHGPIYWAEHFDFHFYTITNEERMAMPEYDANDQTIVDAYNYFPDLTKMPSDYFKLPGQLSVIPMMGKHWLPLNWQNGHNPFQHIIFLGSYAQKNNFIEPMVTAQYLLSGGEFSGNYSQPQTFEEPGNNYPTKYNIYHDSKKGTIYITLSDFVTR